MLTQRSFEGLSKTRIVRESALLAKIVKQMMRKNPNQLLVCIQNLIKCCPSVLKILSRNDILTSIKGRNSVTNLRKMTVNNPKLYLVNINVYTKFDQILSICSQDIERKRNSDIYQGAVTLLHICETFKMVNNHNLDLVNMNVYTKFGQILSFRSQYIERKRNTNIYQGP